MENIQRIKEYRTTRKSKQKIELNKLEKNGKLYIHFQ